jgi:hypothetical protein
VKKFENKGHKVNITMVLSWWRSYVTEKANL